jgi:hypothetical protein
MKSSGDFLESISFFNYKEHQDYTRNKRQHFYFMKYIFTATILLLSVFFAKAQRTDKIINPKAVKKIERVLSSDKMEGRGLYSPGLDKAAAFIAAQFAKAGLEHLKGNSSFFQEFSMIDAKQVSASGTIGDNIVAGHNIIGFTSQEHLQIDNRSGFVSVTISAGEKFLYTAYRYLQEGKNYIVWVDTAQAQNFGMLDRLKGPRFKSDNSVIFVLSSPSPEFSFIINSEVSEKKLKNVAGMIPGKSRPDEFVIFSGHYDHLGISKPDEQGDSIYNGANDDAAGTTAVIMLARYFSKLHNNERTLVFATFTAEESGGFGSQYFSQQFDPAKVIAMFNIEMVGTESKWGKNSAYITGYEKTDMGTILGKNLQGTGFTFHPDPYPDQQLFYRSDNATLARLGVPAHTISTSKMDNEPFYHTPADEINTLDMKNMAEIIKAIALSSRTIISGEDTPTRVDVQKLR